MLTEYLDPGSPIPLYHQLKVILIKKINNGEWRPGSLIPTEVEFIQTFKVSRTTVREAINVLVKEGKLEKKQGKGTIVCQPKIEQIQRKLIGFTERLTNLGFTPGAKLIHVQTVKANSRVKEVLFGGKNDDVLYVKRIRMANDEPIAIEESYWPMEVGELFKEQDLNTVSFFPLMESYGLKLCDADEDITAAVASREEASLLEIKPGAALLQVTRVTYTLGGRPIQFSCNQYRSDRYVYKVHLERE